ncbi:uncharacterized protein LOC121530295 [Drosophila eugracilis]|uniref:uncharacterized protein LOC121530295 n=1 Tax=Drosophila eugracilis TaxID=29029 RepID=UPI001BDA6A40|nr:uncharacterized protein LOC121530295 [Drosophila eugracilis]
MLIIRLGVLFCIFALAAMSEAVSTSGSTESTVSTVVTTTATTVHVCQPRGGYCRRRDDCCKSTCNQVAAECN